jgi:hypothetical protein
MTQVLNLETGAMQAFSLLAPQAVVAAFEQSRGNWNTWDYDPVTHPHIEFGPSGRTVFCGPFGAIIEHRVPLPVG